MRPAPAGKYDDWLKAAKPKKPRRPKAPEWFGLYEPHTYYARGWTDSRYEQVNHFKEVVYKAIHAIAKAVACQAPNVSRARGGETLQLDETLAYKGLAPIQAHEDLEPVEVDHPLRALLYDSNPWDTGWSLRYETVMYLLLTGSGYWWTAEKNGFGLPTSLWVIPSHWIWPVPGNGTMIDHYEVRPIPGSGANYKLSTEEVIHFKWPSPISKLDGYSPMTAGALSADVYESILRSKFHTFKNGVLPQVAVEFDEDYHDPDTDTLDHIERKFVSRYSGENRAGRPLFVPPGAHVKPFSHSPRECDFGVSGQHSEDDILALFGVPPVILGKAKQMTYGSVVAATAAFCEFTVNPLLDFLGAEATQKLAWKYDRSLRIWFPEKTPNDPEHREKEIENDLRNGVRSVNEVRRVRGLEPYQHGGDNPVIAAIGVELPYGTGKPSVKAEPLTEATAPHGPEADDTPGRPASKSAIEKSMGHEPQPQSQPQSINLNVRTPLPAPDAEWRDVMKEFAATLSESMSGAVVEGMRAMPTTVVHNLLPPAEKQTAPVVNVTVPKQDPPIVNVTLPEQPPAEVTVNVEAPVEQEFDVVAERGEDGFPVKYSKVKRKE
jgi:HK97 family phage portal protein